MDGNFEKQPKGFALLFFTELLERFGFYALQAILILYLSRWFHYSDNHAYLIYGAFSSLLYLMPVIGGYVADRFIGFRQAILFGAFFLVCGYLVMTYPKKETLFLGLSLVVFGNGFFKPNVSTILGDLYRINDPRRDAGFTLFYMGINIGALLPPLFIGILVAAYAWSSGFLVAAGGAALSFFIFLSGIRSIRHAGRTPSVSPLRSKKNKGGVYVVLLLGISVAIPAFYLLLHYPKEAVLTLIVFSLGVVGSVLFFLFREKTKQKQKLIACLLLILISIGFWAIYNQTFTSLMLFADRSMSKKFLGLSINAEFTQFFNPFFILFLSPFLSRLWLRLERGKINPSTPTKFGLGILFMAFGFFLLWAGLSLFSQEGLVSPWWLVFSYFLQTVGELLLSPIGLSMVTTLAPRHLVGMMMGVWFLTQSAAFAIGGALATFATVPAIISGEEAVPIYARAFGLYGLFSLGLAAISFCFVPYLKRLILGEAKLLPTPKE